MKFTDEQKLEQEVSRTYIYPDMEILIEGAVLLQWNASEPDRHFLKLGSGGLRLVTPGWRVLEIAAPDWP